MCDTTGLPQRRACRLTGLSLSTCRYEAQRPTSDAHLSGRITELALERKRFGYRRIWQLLRREGLHVNHNVEWAAKTVNSSYWAKLYCQWPREKGKSHQSAIRALAFKWIRIIYRCWKTRTRYDEAKYLLALEARKSPLLMP